MACIEMLMRGRIGYVLRSNQRLHKGYSLLELSIALAILGVMTAGGLSVGATVVEQQANIASNAQLDEITKALNDYYRVNGRLPCVASLVVPLGHVEFGKEIAPNGTNCHLDTSSPAGTYRSNNGGHWVRVGALPVRALGLKDRMMADEFGNRYTYAVTEILTSAANFDTGSAAIILHDGGGNNVSEEAAFAVLSHGNDGKGAYRFQSGAEYSSCMGTALDVENCNDDAVFRDARFNNGEIANKFHDDFVRWLPKFRLSNSSAANAIWQQNNNHLYFDDGGIGIGTDNPGAAKFWVTGDVPNDWLARFYNNSMTGYGVYSETANYAFYGRTTGDNSAAVRGDTISNNSYGMMATANTNSSYAFYAQNSTNNYGCYVGDRNQFSLRCQGPAQFVDRLGVGGPPSTSRTLYVHGDIEAYNSISNQITINNSGPHNSWSRLYLKTAGYEWAIGTSHHYHSNELYLLANGARVVSFTTSGIINVLNLLLLSDERLKKNIEPLGKAWALEKVKQLQGVSYEWKKKGDPGTRYGFIAQQVEKILPSAVATQKSEDLKDRKSIRYTELIAIQNEAIKALSARNDVLEQRIERLEHQRDATLRGK